MEKTIRIPNIEALLDGGATIRLSVKATEEWEMSPIGYRYGSGEREVVIKQSEDEESQIVFNDGDPILPVFCFIDNNFQITSEGEVEIEVLEGDAIVLSDNFVSSASKPRVVNFPKGRFIAEIIVYEPSQLCFDLWDQEEEHPHSSICIAHEEDGDQRWANVYADKMKQGLWVASMREKLGFFNYEKNKKYKIMISFSDGVLGFTVCPDGREPFKLRDFEAQGKVVSRVRIRETPGATGVGGSYEVSTLGSE